MRKTWPNVTQIKEASMDDEGNGIHLGLFGAPKCESKVNYCKIKEAWMMRIVLMAES